MKIYVVTDGTENIANAFSSKEMAEAELNVLSAGYANYFDIWELELDKYVNAKEHRQSEVNLVNPFVKEAE